MASHHDGKRGDEILSVKIKPMGKSRYKVTNDRKVLEWYGNASDRIRSALYFEIDCGSHSNTYLMANGESKSLVVFRVNNNFVDRFDTSPLASPYINIRWLKIIGLKQKTVKS